MVGGAFGIGAVAHEQGSLAPVASAAQSFAIDMGWKRRREPQPGDYWGGCNDARAAGVAPLYSGEPGYRDDMDGDDDGVACEPHLRY